MNQQEQMYALVKQWRESGFLKSKFCRDQHISVHQFNYWLKKFNKKGNNGESKPEVCFFSVENPDNDKKRSVSKSFDRKMRIDLPGGITITIY